LLAIDSRKDSVGVTFEEIPFGNSKNFFRRGSFDLANQTICSQVSAPQITAIIPMRRMSTRL